MLATDAGFLSRLNNLSRQVNETRTELGHLLRTDGSQQLPNTATATSLSYTLSGVYSEAMHLHPLLSGGGFKLSAGDFQTLYLLYKGGHMHSVEEFRYCVVSTYGCTVVQVTDPAAFERFGQQYELAATKEKLKKDLTTVPLTGSFDLIMQEFIAFLTTGNSGLSVVFGKVEVNETLVTSWAVKEVVNGQLKDKNCD